MERLSATLGLSKGSKPGRPDVSTKEFPADPNQYELLDDCGRGVSATVHRAICKSLNEVVAVKKLNLESVGCSLEEIIHEAQTMRSYNHPNVLSLYASFVVNQDLYMITPFMAGGSVLHILKYAYPEGLDEVTIATVMRDVLRGLEYVHKNGGIHRDVKAGNILIDKDGSVKIGDFGVAATIERGGSWGNDKVVRTTFVGTPCWMAPEVMEQTQGYDSSADIWSFGITLLELANGHAPFAKFPPMKVLLMTLQNPPPSLEDTNGRKHFSKNMRDVVARCLQKDPSKRPTATQLLEHKFFKQGRDNDYLMHALLAGLPALSERVHQIRSGKAATSAADNERRLELSQEEYVKGVSAWNFDLTALKAQAALEPDDGSVPQTPTYAPSMPTIMEGGEEVGSRADSGANSLSVSRRSTGADDGGPAGGGSAVAAALTAALPSVPELGDLKLPPLHLVAPGATSGGGAASSGGGASPAPASRPRTPSAFTGGTGAAAANAALGAIGNGSASSDGGAAPAPHVPPPSAQADPGAPPAPGQQQQQPGAVQQQSPPQQQPPGAAGAALAAGGGAAGAAAATAAVPSTSPNGSASPAISRESSSQGPLSGLATPPALLPAAGSSKQKGHGRFKVYEADEVPPPMSPPAARAQEAAAAAPFLRAPGSLLSESGEAGGRASDAATEAAPAAAAAPAPGAARPPLPSSGSMLQLQASESSDLMGGGASEPVKRGRFKVTEEPAAAQRGSFNKTASMGDLMKRGGAELGPKALAALAGAGGGVLLPELARLQEAAAAQAAALARLVEAVRGDGGGGTAFGGDARLPSMGSGVGGASGAGGGLPLSRSASVNRSLVAASSSAAVAALLRDGGDAVELAERLHERVVELERKMCDVIEENGRLKLRSADLAALLPSEVLAAAAAVDSNASSRNPSRRTSSNLQLLPPGSQGGSALVSPLISPRGLREGGPFSRDVSTGL